MIAVDRREPPDLDTALIRLNLEISRLTLPFGDLCFAGHGEFGPATVGFERKRLSDLINSMKDRRLAGHQLHGLWESYDYVVLIAEGVWRPGGAGEIEELVGRDWRPAYSHVDRQSVNYQQLDAYLNSLSLRSRHEETGEPLRVKRSGSIRETAAIVASLYRGFQKRWEDHHAHDQIYAPEPSLGGKKGGRNGGLGARGKAHGERAAVTAAGRQRKVTPCWRAAAQLPGIDRRAEAVKEHFGTLFKMALAGVPEELVRKVEDYLADHPEAAPMEWMRIDGIGGKRAGDAVRAMLEDWQPNEIY
jgi:ERCC4-type nuclease